MQDPRPAGDSSVNIQGSVLGPVVTGDENTLIFGNFSRRQQKAIWSILSLILLIGTTTIIFIIGDYGQSERSTPVQIGAYTVVLSGSAIGSARFDQQGELRIRKSTDHLPYELCLKVGNPWGAPAPGAIWFGTNGTCFGSGLDAAVVHIRENNGETLITPVDPPPTLKQSMNSFTATPGILAGAYVPDRGEIRFRTSASKIEGAFSLQGLDAFGRSTRGTFTATLTASLVSDDPEALISSPIEPVPYASSKKSNPDTYKANGKRYTVKNIISFKQLQGSAEFIKRAQARFTGAVFVIDSREGGSFVYDPPDSRSDIFPIIGTVVGVNPVYILSGQQSSEDLTAKATINGMLDISGSEPTITITLTTTGTTTTSYEVGAILQLRGIN
ncbi:hypothetical protein [Streptosporangium sp. 'caverna']|uniref:hypothetical protein n=1 Tax=Streptosporangium sp. 'caverna' TaxID=2202249 RepID=UPI0013A6F639|nr:hypothetical protein [Streptosporangium sp. 'caverna']